MSELLHVAFMPVNLFFTVLLLLVLLYWIMVILGALDFDFLDIDFDTDADVDMDVDADADMDLQGDGILRSLLEFFYVGEIPVMVLVSLFGLCAWLISVLGNYYLNPTSSLILLVPILAGNLFVSCILVKIMAIPLRKLFDDPNASRDVMGRICRIVTSEVTAQRMGQGEMPSKGAPLLMNVLAEGDHVFHKDDEAVIVGQNKETGVYLISPVDL